MTALPAANYYSNNSRTEGEGKQVVEDILARLREQPGFEAESELTIAAGSVTPTRGSHSIDTEADAAADDLANAAQTNMPDGSLWLLHVEDPARVVTVKHAAGGAGEFVLHGAADFALDAVKKWLLVKRGGTQWVEVFRSFGDDKAAARAFLGVPLSLVAPTGALNPYVGASAPSGWLLADGKTIGNAASGGTARANADTVDLFTLLWDSMADAEAPVSGGRGASAAADFAANKTIALPDTTGRVVAGREAVESRLTAAVAGFSGATLGKAGGDQSLQQHGHGIDSQGDDAAGSATASILGSNQNRSSTVGTGLTGSGGSQNVQPTIVLNWIIKL